MLARNAVIEAIGSKSVTFPTIDDRVYDRLANWLTAEELPAFGFTLKEGKTWTPEPWTEESVLTRFQSDLSFAIEKAEGERGLSVSSMFQVVRFYLWVLKDERWTTEHYTDYGLDFFRDVQTTYEKNA